MTQQKLKWTAASVVTLSAISVLLWQLPSVRVPYHKRQMQRGWEASDGASVPGPAYDQYEYHLNQLIRFGVVREMTYTFRHIRDASPESRHFVRALFDGPHPAYISFEVPHYNEPSPMQLKVWFYAEHADEWRRYVNERDIVGYRAKFIDA